MYQTIGFIGCGNMGTALAVCAKKSLANSEAKLLFANRHIEKAEALAARLDGVAMTNEALAARCDLLFLGVKPQFLKEMLDGIAPALAKRTDRFVLCSMVTGVTTERLQTLAGGEYPIIRIMPNTASAVGAGVIQICTSGTTETELAEFKTLLAPAGLLDELPERLIDAASAVSGCGPAFLCLALEGMADGGVALGLPRDKALRYAAQTLLGTGKLAIETGLHPGILKDQVTSPGGTTIQGVRALENNCVRAAFMEAVIAAYEKTEALKKNT